NGFSSLSSSRVAISSSASAICSFVVMIGRRQFPRKLCPPQNGSCAHDAAIGPRHPELSRGIPHKTLKVPHRDPSAFARDDGFLHPAALSIKFTALQH